MSSEAVNEMSFCAIPPFASEIGMKKKKLYMNTLYFAEAFYGKFLCFSLSFQQKYEIYSSQEHGKV